MSNRTRSITYTALCIAIGVVLPQAFHTVQNAGSIFLPMHIPVLISGFVVGPAYGLACGIITPLLSHLIFGMPPASSLPGMICELAVYGLVSSLLWRNLKIKNDTAKIYTTLIGAMICGRITYGILNALIFKAGEYTFATWIAAAFTTALPGIIIQLILIPIVVLALKKAKIVN